MATVFISRQLAENSVFLKTLQQAGIAVIGQSLVEIASLPVGPLPETDWIFFYSSNGVNSFFEQISLQKRPIPAVKWGALGAGTAKTLSAHVPVHFIGTGVPATTAEAFEKCAKNQRVLFLGAEKSVNSVGLALKDAIVGMNLAVYSNFPLALVPQFNSAVLVFTSPLNAKTYFNLHPLLGHQQVVAIGQSTENQLLALGISRLITVAEPSEPALAAAALQIIQNTHI